MKKILIFFLLIASLTANATKVYVATTGNDTSGDGTSGTPYLTIAKGVSEASAGDTVYVVAGTYNISSTIILPVEVSLMGEGVTSILSCTGAGAYSPWDETPSLILTSASEGTDGNQSVSHLYFNGNDTVADAGILVYRRSNVAIHDCTFLRFHYYGVRFKTGPAEPTTYSTSNSFHDNVVYDCGGKNVSYGDLSIGGQEGLLIYNNDIQQPLRPGYNNSGFPIKYNGGGHLKGLKIYDNYIYLEQSTVYDEWNISIELFAIHGGCEIYGNTCVGPIDFSAYVGEVGIDDSGGYGYAVKIYNNTLGANNLVSYETYGVTLEREVKGGVYIYNNIIRNVRAGITMVNPGAGVTEDIYIHHNLFYNLGETDGAYGEAIFIGRITDVLEVNYNNIYIDHNTIVDNSAGLPVAGIYFRGGDLITYDSIYIRNNIISGFVSGVADGINFTDCAVGEISIENNLFYGNSTNVDSTTAVFTSPTVQNNITDDPLFISTYDLHLQSTSPCINAGIDVSAITGGTDFHGASLYGAAYDIGAFEYQGTGRVLLIIDDKIATINYKIPLIEH